MVIEQYKREDIEKELRRRQDITDLLDWEKTRRADWRGTWYFLTRFAYTFDPHKSSTSGGVQKFPDWRYLNFLVKEWHKEKLLLVAKSRQMLISWLFVSIYLWEALTIDGRYTFFQSRKEELAGFNTPLSLLSRAKFMYYHLPEVIQEKNPVRMQKRPPLIYVEKTMSTIHAVSQDADVGKTYTSTGVLADELAAQDRARESMGAIMPTLGQDGKYTGVSTFKGRLNFFYYLITDKYSQLY